MIWLRLFIHRLRGLFLKRKMERDLEDEIRSHLDMQIEDNLRLGMSPEEARYEALRKFGGVEQVKESYRDRSSLSVVDSTFQDLRYALRMLRRNPGFTFVAVLTLALGIGANTTIFSVVNAVLLRSLPYRDPDRLVLVSHYWKNADRDLALGADFLEWRDQAKAFEQIAAYTSETVDLTGSGEPERLEVGMVSAELFATLGVAPALGRAFTPEEDMAGAAPAVILSDGLWRHRFGADPQVIGRAIMLGNQSRPVVGIMPPGFRFPDESDLWLPLAMNVAQELGRQGRLTFVNVLGRLGAGVTREGAVADLNVILERQRQANPNIYSDVQVRVIGLSERLVGDVRLALLVMFGAVALVLLIACANVANLLLARSAARQKEMAIRAVVGAGRRRLARQLLTESLLLSILGGVAGSLAANWGVKLIVAMNPGEITRIEESGVDSRVLGFTCAVAVLTGLIAGLFPALQASKTDVNETLKAQSFSHSWRGGVRRTLPALIIAELALALVLLAGVGLMIKSFLRLMAVPKGFNPDGVLTLRLAPSLAKYPLGSPQRGAYFQELLDRVQALPGIQSAALTNSLPHSSAYTSSLYIEGRPPFEPGKEPIVSSTLISPDYFRTMGMRMSAGRTFTSQDGADSPPVVIINETLAHRFFPNENPIGHRLLIGGTPETIVGIVGDTRNLGLDREVNLEIYAPRLQNQRFMAIMNLTAKVAPGQNNPAGLPNLAAAIRNQAHAIAPNEPVNQVMTMDERLSNSVASRRFQMQLLGVFAGIALVIAAVGIYGVISYAVSQRTYEIGVRMALGAQASDVLRMVVWRGIGLALAGVAIGLAAALAITRVMKNLLFNVSATDPLTFALVASLLVAVALIAIYIPARRATKVDPLQALRQE